MDNESLAWQQDRCFCSHAHVTDPSKNKMLLLERKHLMRNNRINHSYISFLKHNDRCLWL